MIGLSGQREKLLSIGRSVALLRLNEKREQSLNWLGLTADEKAKIDKKIPDTAKNMVNFIESMEIFIMRVMTAVGLSQSQMNIETCTQTDFPTKKEEQKRPP